MDKRLLAFLSPFLDLIAKEVGDELEPIVQRNIVVRKIIETARRICDEALNADSRKFPSA